jgi:hypothetical protein
MTDQPLPVPSPDLPSDLLDFAPVPRRYRHDGWTPERQRAFIGALAVTGCVDRAARMVNIAQTNCYELRRAPGAEGFRRAWDAALDFAVPKLKDIAFQRAIEGELVPVFSGGKLMGFRRKYNDKLLMFCLRHYGQDASGRRTTINYFSTRASAGAVAGPEENEGPSTGSGRTAVGRTAVGRTAVGGAHAEASATTVRTVITGPAANDPAGARGNEAAATINAFEGVPLDAEAQAAIAAALEACAARARDSDLAYDKGGDAAVEAAADDPEVPFVRADLVQAVAVGALEPAVAIEEFVPFVPGEAPWELAGAEKPAALVAFEARAALEAKVETAQAPARAKGAAPKGGRALSSHSPGGEGRERGYGVCDQLSAAEPPHPDPLPPGERGANADLGLEALRDAEGALHVAVARPRRAGDRRRVGVGHRAVQRPAGAARACEAGVGVAGGAPVGAGIALHSGAGGAEQLPAADEAANLGHRKHLGIPARRIIIELAGVAAPEIAAAQLGAEAELRLHHVDVAARRWRRTLSPVKDWTPARAVKTLRSSSGRSTAAPAKVE